MTQLSSGDVSKTMFGNLHEYQEAAFLLFQINSNNQDQWGNINWAVWEIFDPGINPGSGNEKEVAFWLNMAQTTDLSRVDFSGVEIHHSRPTRISGVFVQHSGTWDADAAGKRSDRRLDDASIPGVVPPDPSASYGQSYSASAVLVCDIIGVHGRRLHRTANTAIMAQIAD